DLARIDLLVLAPPDAHRPATAERTGRAFRGIRLVRRVGDASLLRIAVEPVRDLVVCKEDLRRPFLRERRLLVCSVGGRDESRRNENGDRNRKRAPQCLPRNDQSLLPMKFAGVTSTIATACAITSPTPSSTSSVRIARLQMYATTATTRKRNPWYAKWPRRWRKVQRRFHR